MVFDCIYRDSRRLGESYKKGLKSSDYFLIILSPNSVSSDWVKAETHWAFENRKGKIIPIVLKSCDSSELYLLLPLIQFVNLSDNNKEEWQKLETNLKNILSGLNVSTGSKNSFGTTWTLRGTRIGLEYGVLQSYHKGIHFSNKFLRNLLDIINDNQKVIENLIDNWKEDCMKAVLRTHPGGQIYEEDLDYFSAEVLNAFFLWIFTLAETFNLLDFSENEFYDLNEEFRDELARLLTGKSESNSDDLSFILDTILNISKSAGISRSDNNNLHHIIASLSVCLFMQTSGMLDALINSIKENK